MSRNATIHAANQTQDYFTVLQQVAKHSIHLNYAERLWAVSQHARRHLVRQSPV